MDSKTFGRRNHAIMPQGSGAALEAYNPGSFTPLVQSPEPTVVSAPTAPETLDAGKPVVGLRFVSGLIDSIIMVAMFFGLMSVMADPNVTTPEGNQAEALSILVALIVPGLLYGIIMEASPLQGTLGKVLTRTRITDKQGHRPGLARIILRNVLKLLSGIVPFYLSYLMVFFTEDKQSLHDKLTGTLVFKKGQGPAGAVGQVFD